MGQEPHTVVGQDNRGESKDGAQRDIPNLLPPTGHPRAGRQTPVRDRHVLGRVAGHDEPDPLLHLGPELNPMRILPNLLSTRPPASGGSESRASSIVLSKSTSSGAERAGSAMTKA
jgi:hypothetical protein